MTAKQTPGNQPDNDNDNESELIVTERHWAGIYQVMHDSSQVIASLSTICAYPDSWVSHDNEKIRMKRHMEERFASLLSSIEWFIKKNELDPTRIQEYLTRKVDSFDGIHRYGHLQGVLVESAKGNGRI